MRRKRRGSPVHNAKGEEIGTVSDVLVDPSGGSSVTVLSAGRYVGKDDKMVAVPLSNIEMNQGKMLIPAASQLSLEQMHEFVWRNFYSEGAAAADEVAHGCSDDRYTQQKLCGTRPSEGEEIRAANRRRSECGPCGRTMRLRRRAAA